LRMKSEKEGKRSTKKRKKIHEKEGKDPRKR
jgi:hypothetical protein